MLHDPEDICSEIQFTSGLAVGLGPVGDFPMEAYPTLAIESSNSDGVAFNIGISDNSICLTPLRCFSGPNTSIIDRTAFLR
jgi:hypothetical protein